MSREKKIKIIVAGSRYGVDNDYLKNCLSFLPYIENKSLYDVTIVVGGARGVDEQGKQYALGVGIPYVVFEANWTKFGRSAGPRRNAEMAEYADVLCAFPDDREHSGTQDMIRKMKDKGKEVYIFQPY